MTKDTLRVKFKHYRRQLPNDFKMAAEQAICHHWRQHELAVSNIGSYLALRDECPTVALHDLWWQQRRQVFIPLISQPGSFREINIDSTLIKTPLGIDEPVDGPLVSTNSLDVLIIPLLAIDQHGYRLGYGKGFYDQLLTQCVKKPLLIGLGFATQLVDSLPHDAWDIPLNGFLSEAGWVFF